MEPPAAPMRGLPPSCRPYRWSETQIDAPLENRSASGGAWGYCTHLRNVRHGCIQILQVDSSLTDRSLTT